MALKIVKKGAGARGKSKWIAVANIDGVETEIARSPQNYGTLDTYKASVDRFVKSVIVDIDSNE